MAPSTGIQKAVALAILYSLIPSFCQGESISLQLQNNQQSVCFDQPVLLRCLHPALPSGMFSSARPSWKEDGVIFALDGGMYNSVTQTSPTEHVLELVPEKSHFVSPGTHNYTCFLPLAGGARGVLESNPVQISPLYELLAPILHVVKVNQTSVRLEWNHSRACFEDCAITFNLTWTPSHKGQSESVETNNTLLCISALQPDEDYEATLAALCREQSHVTMVSRTAVVTYRTISDHVETESPSPIFPSHPEFPWPGIIGGSIGFAVLFVALMTLITLLCVCTVLVRRRKLKSESSPEQNAKEGAGNPVQAYDTVSKVTQGDQYQDNPNYIPMVPSLQMPAKTEVSMEANPSYITINDLTGL